jgi:VWFA-related protein
MSFCRSRLSFAIACGVAIALLLPPVAAAQNTPDQAVIQTGTHVVLVSVVAKDKHGKPVAGLRREDFVLRDNGQAQRITLFAFDQSGQQPPALSTAAPPDHLTFTNRPPGNAAAVTVFLFDHLNTRLADQQLAKKDFLRYLRGLPADSRVAVFALGDELALLHDFSQDMASLLSALEKHANRASPEADAATAAPASANSLTGDPKTSAQWDSFMQSSNQQYVDYTETVRAARTAAALETIAGHLQGLPGRKTLIWISGGFPIQLGLHNSVDTIAQSDSTGRSAGGSGTPARGAGGGGGRSGGGSSSNPVPRSSGSDLAATELPGTAQSYETDVARAIRALNEADVAVYPVDARGVMVSPVFQADRSSMGKHGKPPRAVAPPDFNYETMQTLAEETGGQAFHHINDLSAAIQEAAGDARVSYSLAFSPTAESLDGSYHKLEITVSRPDVKVRYRPGYVAAPDEAVAPPLTAAVANPVALSGIGFRVHLEPVDGGYRASVTIDPRNITLQPKDGKWTGSLQFLVVVGTVEQLTTIPLSFSDAMFRQIQQQGIVLGARVKTPPGTTGFSMGFRDIASGIVGTLRVPL